MKITAETPPSSPGAADGSGPSPFPAGTGLVVVGHGTANTIGAAETAAVAEKVGRLVPDLPVELGFLEVIEPSIDAAVGRLADRGCREVLALPILLFAAGHAKRDVPIALAEAAARRGLAVRQAAPLGLHPEIIRLARRRYFQTVADLPPLNDAEALLVVGRGSSDPTAAGQLWGLIRRCFAAVPRIARQQVRVGFVAAAQPSLDDAIRAICQPVEGRPPVGRVVVQPHLLFPGHVETQVTTRLAQAREEQPQVDWLQVPRLGPANEVARALFERGLEAAWAQRFRTTVPGR